MHPSGACRSKARGLEQGPVSFPYIPPRSPGDEPSPEEIALFLEAVARVTDAFRELRDTIKVSDEGGRFHFDMAAYDAWFARWRFDALPCQVPEPAHPLKERIDSWCIDVLRRWQRHPEERERLEVHRGLWEWNSNPGNKLATDRPPRQIKMQSFNMERESFANYRARMIEGFEKVLKEENVLETERMKKYRARTKQRRKRELAPEDSYDIFALHHCRGLSDGEIQLWYKRERRRQLRVATIKMARKRLMEDLNLFDFKT